ncbi:MAG: efflux RND transporter permease subunit, partial [Gemmatimonadetes bacterium]|nr:efflux RND transporter permease subunit [Gemmatimonadota bacterium]
MIRWSIDNRFLVLVAAGLLLVAGTLTAVRMPVDVFPDLTAPTVTVLTEAHGMAPEEVETLVTFPIETAVNGATGVRRVRSATSQGISIVWVEFDWGTDIYRARQTVNERLTSIVGSLPDQVESPKLAPVSSIMGEILFVSLTSDRHSQLDLRTLATTDIRRRLLSVAGVSQVTPIGGEQKQYQVVLSPNRLRAYQITIEQVAEALRETNENVSAGFLVQGGQESIIQGIGRVVTTEDIGDTVVTVRKSRPIKVSDLGVVVVGTAIKRGTGSASRRGPNWEPIIEPGVIIAIQKQPGADTLTLDVRIEKTLDSIQAEIHKKYPDVVIQKEIFKQADFIEAAIANVEEAIRDGAIWVIVVLFIFLWNFRTSVITLTAIPLSILLTVIVFHYWGITINTMTLGGLAIAIGALVDDSIVDIENIYRRLKENKHKPHPDHPLRVVYHASMEIRNSIVYATLIVVLIVFPLFSMAGLEGRMFAPMGISYLLTMLMSLLVS